MGSVAWASVREWCSYDLSSESDSPFCSVRALKIYFAGPLFTPYERSFIDECAAALRADGFEVFVPHEHELATGVDVTAAWIFAKDRPGIERADAMLAILDGPSVDDGTACEIGMFHALMQSDPSKKGIVGLLTDIRGTRGESTGVNLFVQGVIEDVGRIVASIEEARDVLRAWRSEWPSRDGVKRSERESGQKHGVHPGERAVPARSSSRWATTSPGGRARGGEPVPGHGRSS
jgi:hypothetical protein